MQQEFSRTEILIGEEGIELLAKAKVAVFGLGGVGSYVVEALARCGVGSLILVDHDVISASNINRQLFALHSTVGQFKTEVAKARVRDIDSDILVHTYQTFYSGETAQLFDLKSCDYIVDAIDTVSSKLLLIENAKNAGVNLLRVWGGGFIESEYFYKQCTLNGIMVWQDFLQSSSGVCNAPSTDEAFMKKMKEVSDHG